MEKFPIYEMNFNEDDKEAGVFAVSYVVSPANEKKYVMLSELKEEIKFELNEDKQVVTGVILIPEQLILRKNPTGDFYYLKASAQTIEKLAIKYAKDGHNNNATLDHKTKVDTTTFFESWIIEDPNNDKSNALGFKDLVKGTWMVSNKVHDKQLWEKIKEGDYTGFSLEAFINRKLVENEKIENNKKENIYNKKENNMSKKSLMEKLKDLLSMEDVAVKFADYKLVDASILRVNEDNTVVFITEEGEKPVEDGSYDVAVAEGEEPITLKVKDGKLVVDSPEAELKEVKSEFSKTKTDFEKVKADFEMVNKELETVKAEFEKVKADYEAVKTENEEKNKKIIELSKTPNDEKFKTAVEKMSKEEFEKLPYHERQTMILMEKVKNMEN